MDRQNSSSQVWPFFNIFDWWHKVTPNALRKDLFAGLTGAVIVLPQGVAFALLAGLPPAYGLYTAIVPVIIAALFGSSHQLVSGPTTPIAIVVFTTASALATPETPDYISLVLTLTFLVGVFQLAMGLARLGMLVNFISHAVIIGFTAGAALLIITSQLKNLLALDLPHQINFWSDWQHLIEQLPQTNFYALAVGLVTFASALLIRRLNPNWPSLFIAIVIGALVSQLLGDGAKGILLLNSLPTHLPALSSPNLSLDTISKLAPGALAIALLGLIEAVSIARSIATHTHQHHDANREFVGQGLSNVAGSFFASFASSGSFSRSAINHRAGAQTPLAAVFSALLVLLVILFAAPLAAYLPIPAMAAVLILVAMRLVEWQQIKVIFKASPVDAVVFVTTFAATMFVELTFAVYVGVMLSLVLHLNRISHPNIVSLHPENSDTGRRFVEGGAGNECPQLKIMRIDGSLFFGSINYIERALHDIDKDNPEQKHVLITGIGINFIDVAGAELLIREAKRRREFGGDLYFCDVKEGVFDILRRGGYLDQLGEDHVFDNKAEAIEKIFPQLDPERCKRCQVRTFTECDSVPPYESA
jgi:SulP family sulfate permease